MLREWAKPDDNWRSVPFFPDGSHPDIHTSQRDFVHPLPVGTHVVMVFRVVGYDQDCDGSAMARLEHVNRNGETTGWAPTHLGLYPDTDLVVDEPGDLWALAARAATDSLERRT